AFTTRRGRDVAVPQVADHAVDRPLERISVAAAACRLEHEHVVLHETEATDLARRRESQLAAVADHVRADRDARAAAENAEGGKDGAIGQHGVRRLRADEAEAPLHREPAALPGGAAGV